MKFRTLSILFSIIITTILFPQQKTIIIKAEPDTLPSGSSVYITGNTDQLGNWLFNISEPMKLSQNGEWYYQVTAAEGDTLQFKFTRGDWSTEAVDTNGFEFPNFTYVVEKDTTLSYRIPNWRDLVLEKVIISPERMTNKGGRIELIEGWKYKVGDDTAWANPTFDDQNWKSANPLLPKEELDGLGWNGNIWFRNHLYVDSSFWNKPFGLDFSYTGAAEIYLNGKLLYRTGEVGSSSENEYVQIERLPRYIVFESNEEQILATRYSNHSAENRLLYNFVAGFTLEILDLDFLISNRFQIVRQLSIQQLPFSAFILAFSVMHFLLFVFYPKAKENLFYSVSMLGFAAVIFTANQTYFASSLKDIITLNTINSVGIQLSIIFGLLTVYASSYTKMPRQFLLFVFLSALFLFITIFFPALEGSIYDYLFYAFSIIILLEIFRVVIRSIRNKDPWGWSWIVGIGFIVAMILIAYQILIITDFITQPLFGIRLVYVYGIVFLAVTVSINLSKKVSDTSTDLEKQLVQVKELSEKTIYQERKAKEEELARKLLESDNARKTKELEEARKLQLSMLPDKVPVVPGLELSVYMKPATEVGGDYYDFKLNTNSLIIAIGDATGHGMKAGTMVATIKGLFTAEIFNSEIFSFMNKSNSVVRDMRLGNLFMAMLIAKINKEKITLSSAGMPPALIYRNNEKIVEEIRLQALPLGGTSNFQYSQKTVALMPGNTILLMSDGFPELFNPQKEILDYGKATEIFGSIAELSPQIIIDRLCEEADKWRGDRFQEDDITFIVIKVKDN
jgi:serine phosphatase RsbU (regulator of sigma subunit)